MLFETIQTRINARITRLVFTLIYSRWAISDSPLQSAF